MAIKNYLIEGVSGSGKTTVAEALERRGFQVVHGDRVLAYYGDPETGEALVQPDFKSEAERTAWLNARWIWPVVKVKALIADQSHPITFFCGGSRNSKHFVALFDQIFVLDVDSKTLQQRLNRRPEDEFGGRPIEQDLIFKLHAAQQIIRSDEVRIDASWPIEQVVDQILAHIRPLS